MSAPGHRVECVNLARSVEAPDNGNLRELCLREGLRLYFGLGPWLNCGGQARCGRCLVRIVEGADMLSPPTPFERIRLPGAGAELRLACQANVRGALRIDTRGRVRGGDG